MKIDALAHLPNCEQEQSLDVAFLYYDFCYYLSYECGRDFLSAPKNYALIKLSHKTKQSHNLTPVQYDCFDYDESGECLQRGCYSLTDAQGEQLFFLSGLGFSITLCYQDLEVLQRVYHVVDAQQALLNYLSAS